MHYRFVVIIGGVDGQERFVITVISMIR